MHRSAVLFVLAVLVSTPLFAQPANVMAPDKPLNIAHRGARSIAPENTMAAFRIAVDRCGAEMIELDVHLSSDGLPIVVHDDTLERTTDVATKFPDRKPYVGMFTGAELLSLDAGSWFVAKDPFGQIKAGNVPAGDIAEFTSGRVRLPTLKQALVFCRERRLPINVEIKAFPAYYAGLADKVVECARAEKMTDLVVLSCFDHEVLWRLKQIAPEMKRAALVEDPVFPLDAYVRDTLGAMAFNPSMDVLGFSSMAYLERGQLRRDLVEAAHAAGLKVFVWTVNDEKAMRALAAIGVDGLFTDFPQRLRDLRRPTKR